MGRRARRRDFGRPRQAQTPAAPTPPASEPVHARAPSPRARLDEAPPAPWSPFPLVELVVLLAFVLLALGLFAGGGARPALMACGVALASLAGAELAVREHLAGYRSHSSLLAGLVTVLVAAPLYLLTSLRQELLLALAIMTFGLVFVLARRGFRARSGGLAFRA